MRESKRVNEVDKTAVCGVYFEDEFNTRTFPQIVVDNSSQRKHIGGAAELAQYFKEKSLPK